MTSQYLFLLTAILLNLGHLTASHGQKSALMKQSFLQTIQTYLKTHHDCKIDTAAEFVVKVEALNATLNSTGCNSDQWEKLVRPIYATLRHPEAADSDTKACEQVKALVTAAHDHPGLLEGLCFSKSYVMQCGDEGHCECLMLKMKSHDHHHNHHHLQDDDSTRHAGHNHKSATTTAAKCQVDHGSNSGSIGVSSVQFTSIIAMISFLYISIV